MGWLPKRWGRAGAVDRRIAPLESSGGHREIEGPEDFPAFFRALDGWLPDACTLYFESGSPDAEIESFMAAHATPDQTRIAMGTLWPKPRVFHVPATSAALRRLAAIMERHAAPELAVHVHVYRAGAVLLQWHDAFAQEMIVAASVPDEAVAALVERIRGGKAGGLSP